MNKSNNTIIIILAAGKGTRMKSAIPKVLHKINNQPMICSVIETSKQLNPYKIITIVGYKKNMVINAINNKKIIFIDQKEQKGTGHAIKQCLDEIKTFRGNILILSGDTPLIKYKTLLNFINSHNRQLSSASLISTSITNPIGYGRIIKNKLNQLEKIVEQKDANNEELKINEINSGIYIFNSKILNEKIPLIDNNNNQNEFYLTDIFNFIDSKNTYIHFIKDSFEISGINTINHLNSINKKLFI